jgi:hypothetical protein
VECPKQGWSLRIKGAGEESAFPSIAREVRAPQQPDAESEEKSRFFLFMPATSAGMKMGRGDSIATCSERVRQIREASTRKVADTPVGHAQGWSTARPAGRRFGALEDSIRVDAENARGLSE